MKNRLFIIIALALLLLCVTGCGGGKPAEENPATKPNIDIHFAPDASTLEAAKRNGYVVFEDSRVTAGQEIWDDFVAKTEAGEPCFVWLASWYSPDEWRPEPVMYVEAVEFDGEEYVYFYHEAGVNYIKRYKYMKKYTEDGNANVDWSTSTRYFLVNDERVTWNQIVRGMFSSNSMNWVDHETVYRNYTPRDGAPGQ